MKPEAEGLEDARRDAEYILVDCDEKFDWNVPLLAERTEGKEEGKMNGR